MTQNQPQQPNLVPFGKYKGQPVEALAQDQQYVDWLVAQPWFKERFGNLYTVIINNFGEPSETPEHNALQARFLSDDFRLRFASIAIPRLWWFASMGSTMTGTVAEWVATKVPANRLHTLSVGPYFRKNKSDTLLLRQSKIIFENDGIDASWRIVGGLDAHYDKGAGWCKDCSIDQLLRIEIKPNVGDDYPAILRQMRANGSTILFTRSYVGSGVDEPTFMQFMDSQGIRVILENEVDATELIRVDEFDFEKFSNLVAEIRRLNSL